MNKRLAGIIAAAVLVVAAAAAGVAVWYNAGNYVAKVGDTKITKTEYKYFLYSMKYQLEQQYSQAGVDSKSIWTQKMDGGKTGEETLRESALEQAVNLKVQLKLADEAGIKLSKDEITQVDSQMDDMIKKNGRNETDKQVQSIYHLSINDVREMNREAYLASKYMSEQEKKITPSDADLKTTYDADKDKYDQVTIQHILFMTVDSTTQQALPEDKQAEKKKAADAALVRAKAGEDFGKMAKELSEDGGSKDKNGEYTFGKGQMVAEFEDWAFKAKAGDMGIVKSTYGYHVMKFIKRTSFDDVKDSVKEETVSKQYQDKLAAWKKEARFAVSNNSKVLDGIVIQY